MRHVFIVIIGFVVLLLADVSSVHAEKRVALVIGNDDYAVLPDLNNARTDAEGMAAKLRELGFDVILRLNATERIMGRSLAEFEDRLAKADVGLVFYAGHGIQAEGRNYLIPADAQVEIEEDLPYEGVDSARFLEAMKRAGSPLNIVILDACRDNPLPRRTRSAARGLTVVPVPSGIQGTAILYSAAPGQTAQDGPKGGHGVFTGELLKVLDKPGLTLEDVFKRTAVEVAAQTGRKQDPWFHSSVKGDFYFRSDNGAAEAKITSSSTADKEALFWQSIQDSDKADDFAAYLSQFPQGTFAGLARNRIAALTPEPLEGPSRDQIRRVQRLLTDIGLDPGPIDGFMGSKTRTAIERFELSEGLIAIGDVTETLLAHLDGARERLAAARATRKSPVAPQSFEAPKMMAAVPPTPEVPAQPTPPPNPAGETFAAALNEANGISDAMEKARALEAIAIAQAETGDFDGAIQTVDSYPNEHADRKRRAHEEIAKTIAQGGDVTRALGLLGKGRDATDTSHARSVIAKERAKAGDWDGALEAAMSIAEDVWKKTTLAFVANTQAEAGVFDGARQTVTRILFDDYKIRALSDIAIAQTKAGDAKGARRTVEDALLLADAVKDPEDLALSFVLIAEAQSKTGDGRASSHSFELAIDAAKRIDETKDRADSFALIAKYLAKSGDVDGARSVFERAADVAGDISDPDDRANGFLYLASRQAEAGELKGAKRSVEAALTATLRMKDDDLSNELDTVARAFATIDEVDRALNVYEKISDVYGRVYQMCGSARVLWKDGKGETARRLLAVAARTVADAGSGHEQYRLMLSFLIEAQAKTGDIAGATRTAMSADPRDRSGFLLVVADSQGAAGDFDGVRNTLGWISDGFDRMLALSDLAQAQANAGDIEGATKSASGIERRWMRNGEFRAIALSRIAVAHAKQREGPVEVAKPNLRP